MREPNPHKLSKITPARPDRQSPAVDRLVADVADADAKDAQAVLVRKHRAGLFAERLREAVATVRANQDLAANAALARVIPDDVVGAGEHNPFNAAQSRYLI